MVSSSIHWTLKFPVRGTRDRRSSRKWSGYKVKPGYEGILDDLVGQLKQLREQYKDTTREPVKF
jgi:hypothetical protein